MAKGMHTHTHSQQNSKRKITYDPNLCKFEMLYHYTSLEKLALILRNRTIRLNPLDKMDDLQEQKTADVPNLGKFIYVSAWTSEKDESIPMWKMYTDTRSGVRIGLPPNPFVTQRITGEDVIDAGVQWKREEGDPKEVEVFLNPIEMLKQGYITRQAFSKSILIKVQYTQDINLLEPKVAKVLQGKEIGNFAPLGRYKNKHWGFQKEWRYLLEFVPMKLDSPDRMLEMFRGTVTKMMIGIEKAPFQYYDLSINSEAFSKMQIVTSPHFTPGNQILLETLLQRYNASATIKSSSLLNLI